MEIVDTRFDQPLLRLRDPGLAQVGVAECKPYSSSPEPGPQGEPAFLPSASRRVRSLLPSLMILARTGPVPAGGRWEARVQRPLFVNTPHVRSPSPIRVPLEAPEDAQLSPEPSEGAIFIHLRVEKASPAEESH